ncbi:hypothetical protein FBU59_000985 [Linderina macrospora]|uniref:Uncharacterized protein n=1 Tax=Linderina macrospora TaxID=4868 RepID=A0ACC1JFK0_9FUNG|nr:hypothetical protein FBU59_000985 [Linderina macrospora]
MLSKYNTVESKVEHLAINSCLTPLYALDGKHVTTIEGIGSPTYPHPVQERIALLHGTQCGFCSPGFSMSLYALLRNNSQELPTEAEIEECLAGNLCRCTGYRPILDAAKTLARDNRWNQAGAGCGRADCCKLKEKQSSSPCETKSRFRQYDASQELIFPPPLVRYAKAQIDSDAELCMASLRLESASSSTVAYRPVSMVDLHNIFASYPDAALVAGNTAFRLHNNAADMAGKAHVYISDIVELQQLHISDDGRELVIGGCATLAKLLCKVRTVGGLGALGDCLERIGNSQVRNTATVGGHLAAAPSASDLIPVLLVLGTSIDIQSAVTGTRRAVSLEGYLQDGLGLTGGEIITSLRVPMSSSSAASDTLLFVHSLKQSMRKANDSAIVSCGMRVSVDLTTYKVLGACFVFAGIAQKHFVAQKTATIACGSDWSDSRFVNSMLLETCAQEIASALPGNTDRPKYRVALAASLLYQFWMASCKAFGIDSGFGSDIPDDYLEYRLPKPMISEQVFAPVEEKAIIGKGEPHLSALKHTTGEAVYVDDMPPVHGELFVALVLSTRSHAQILSIDPSKALAMDGVHPKLFTASDIPGSNLWNIWRDEEILASKEVHFYGQIIAAVAAKDRDVARRAADAVEIEYEDLPAIYSIDEAIEQESFFEEVSEVECGDVEAAFADADFVFEGEVRCGAQEHLYMEPQAFLIVPKGEDNEYDVFATTQATMSCQMTIASALGIPANRVYCRTKRLGGGFGGKDSIPAHYASIAAVVAQGTRKPARLVLTRKQDMQTTGHRHPFLGKWKVGVMRDGRITGRKVEAFSNGGHSHDESIPVMCNCLSSLDGCYYSPNAHFIGKVCKTNITSMTAFRGFGGCQSEYIMESMMSEIAERLGMNTDKFRQMNMYTEGALSPSAYQIHDWTVPQMFEEIQQSAEYAKRKAAVDEFNARSMFRKRGIALVPTKHGITLGIRSMLKAAALVHIYIDGSVMVHHHGVEMGQGLHTKIAMIAADALDIPLSSVYINGSSTEILANPTPTAASISTDLNGSAVLKACRALAARLQPFRDRMPNSDFAAVVGAAFADQVDLSERAFFGIDGLPEDFANKRGFNYLYYTQGVAIAEVELDTLTGSHTIHRADILMDVGRSINKALDIGQIEGAFMQGVGWCTTEEILLDASSGAMSTNRLGLYRVPTCMDIPRDFRVAILEGVEYKHLKNIHSSRAVGEPPLFLGSSVFFALREAIKAARGSQESLHIDIPATVETLRMACADSITSAVDRLEEQGKLAKSSIQRI